MSQRKTETEILKKHLCYGNPHSKQDDLGGSIEQYVFLPHLKGAMEEYAQQEVEARDELIKELRDALKKSIDVIKMWHDSDKEGWADKLSWDTYSQYDPDMTSITNVLTKAQSFNQE